MHIDLHVCLYTYVYIYMYIHKRICVSKYFHTQVYTYICTHICIHIYIYVNIIAFVMRTSSQRMLFSLKPRCEVAYAEAKAKKEVFEDVDEDGVTFCSWKQYTRQKITSDTRTFSFCAFLGFFTFVYTSVCI